MSENKDVSTIEEYLSVPEHIQDKIKNVVEKVRGGYELIETRPRWDGSPGPWTRCSIAKMIFHKPSKMWKVYWKRASGKWYFYSQSKSLKSALKSIQEDKYGCFWG